MGRATDNSAPGALAAMLGVDGAAPPAWEPQDLAAVLRHLLAAAPAAELPAGGPAVADRVGSFGELLRQPHPPVELLVLTKDFAKASREDAAGALPKDVATVLYFAAIVVARRRCGGRITRLSDGEVRAGVEWVLAQPWVDGAARALFEEGSP
jgi:hypothetical protein